MTPLEFSRLPREPRDDRQLPAQTTAQAVRAQQVSAQFDRELLDRLLLTEDELIAIGAVKPRVIVPAQFVPRADFDRRLNERLDACEVRLRMLGAFEEVRHAA